MSAGKGPERRPYNAVNFAEKHSKIKWPSSEKTLAAPTDLFYKCVTISKGCRRYEIACKFGNWSVSAGDKISAEREARHYWGQYLNDGVYDKLIENEERTPKQ